MRTKLIIFMLAANISNAAVESNTKGISANSVYQDRSEVGMFIDSDQLDRALNVVSNISTGSAFRSALEVVSPVVAEKVDEMNVWIKKTRANSNSSSLVKVSDKHVEDAKKFDPNTSSNQTDMVSPIGFVLSKVPRAIGIFISLTGE